MKKRDEFILDRAFSESRRRFSGLLGGSGLLALTACGGGSDAPAPPVPAPAPTPAPSPPPTPTGGIELLAGGLGGAGFLQARGTAARITNPESLAAGRDGVVYFSSLNRAARVSSSGEVEFLVQLPHLGGAMACDSQGVLHVTVTGISTIYRLVEDGTPRFVPVAGAMQFFPSGGFVDGTGVAAQMRLPRAPVFDSADNLYFIDSGNRAIRKMTPAGTVTTVAGQPSNTTMVDGQGAAAGFEEPSGMVLMPDGSFLILDKSRFRRMTPTGQVTTLAGMVPPILANSLVANDNSSVYALLGNSIVRVGLDGTTTVVAGAQVASGYAEGAGANARFDAPADLISSGGTLIVSDRVNSVLRRVAPATGQTTPWIGAAAQPGRVDGVGSEARFAAISAVTVDQAGNTYVLDSESKALRKVTAAGVTSTLFQDFPSDGGVAVDPSGNFYGVRDRAIVKVSATGVQSLFAGQAGSLGFADGPAATARFARPLGLAFDPQGNLLVGDSPELERGAPFTYVQTYRYGNTLRKITPAGDVSTFAGTPGRVIVGEFTGPTGLNLVTDFPRPQSLAFDGAGNIVILDPFLGSVRRIAAAGGMPFVLAGAPESFRTSLSGLAVAPSGQIFYGQKYFDTQNAPSVTIRRVVGDGTTVAVAGDERPDHFGVGLGALPGSLGTIAAMVAAADKTLLVASENALLRFQLA